MGAPLVKSLIETEQPVPLVILDPTGTKASCVNVRIHWNPQQNVGPDDEATSFTLDVGPEHPSASVFSAQLWNASLAAAMAWQEPWLGARWMIYNVPLADGSGIDAGLAVGMIATSARRPYPKTTAVIGSLRPDQSLGPVSQIMARLDAAAAAGITRVIIPSQQRKDIAPDGHTQDVMRHAADLHLECEPVDDLVAATEAAMHDPLPDLPEEKDAPTYSPEVAVYIDSFAQREQTEAQNQLAFAPQEAELATYPPQLAVIWRLIREQNKAAKKAYEAKQPYLAYQLFSQVNAEIQGANTAMTRGKAPFDIKTALADSDDLRQKFRDLLVRPTMDKGELQSALLVAEMSDWVYGINAQLEGAQLVAKQTYSLRTDATTAERDQARNELLFAIEMARYQLNQSGFYSGLAAHIGVGRDIPVYSRANRWLPQLIPAQLAIAQVFTNGLRERANEMRDALLFDARLATYVRVMHDAVVAWEAREHARQIEQAAAQVAPANTSTNAPPVGFDPGNSYRPPVAVAAVEHPKTLSEVALCLSWVNDDCEVATLDEKYLRLAGTIDPNTHAWRAKDRAQLESLLQQAEIGARRGTQFAVKVGLDPSVLGMIYEKASHLRIQGDDAAALEALRSYWRCALLGNMCWQLAYAPKANPVDLGTPPPSTDTNTPPVVAPVPHPATNAPPVVAPQPKTNAPPVALTNAPPAQPVVQANTNEPPVVPIAHSDHEAPRALPVALPVNLPTTNTPPVALPVTPPGTNTPPAAIPVNPPAH